MANYGSKFTPNPQGVYPENAVDGREFSRSEPLLTVDKLVSRHLHGIQLVSQVPNRLTGEYDIKGPEELKEHVIRAVNQLELDTGIHIFPVQYEEQHPLDRVHIEQSGYFRLRNKPILTVDELNIRPVNNMQGTNVYTVPKEWISFTHAVKGQINIVPLIAADSQVFQQAASTNGAAFTLTFLSQIAWTPSFWQVKYTAGLPEGEIPMFINEAVGCYAALDILADVIQSQTANSYSLGLDGMSQSQQNSVPENLEKRIELLEAKRQKLVKKIRAYYGMRITASTI